MTTFFILICFFLEGCRQIIWAEPENYQNFNNKYSYYRDSECPYLLHHHLQRFFHRHQFRERNEQSPNHPQQSPTDPQQSTNNPQQSLNNPQQSNQLSTQIYFACDYTTSEQEFAKLNLDVDRSIPRWVFILPGDRYLAGKQHLWNRLVETFGLHGATQYMPSTYNLDNSNDMLRLKTKFQKDNLFIMKNNKQRQSGLKITNNWQDLATGKDNGYLIAQELLQDPFLVDGRKINLRVYMLIYCYQGKHVAYMYDDGFMYYTKVPFKVKSLDTDVNVTTGYIDRKVYEKNPLTLKDFRAYLDKNHYPGADRVLFDRIEHLLHQVMVATDPVICPNDYKYHHLFQLFGVDVAVNNQLQPQIMEINKGPDLEAKDSRDQELKDTLLDNVFFQIGFFEPTTNQNTGFKQIFES